MGQEHTVDLVSKLDLQELRNAVQMAQKEISTRFDFRGSHAGVLFEENPPLLNITADHEAQLKSVLDVVETKLAKRGISMQALVWKAPDRLPSGGFKRQAVIQQGLSSEQAKAIVKAIKGLSLKIQPRIDKDTVRVSGKQIDDLQTVIRMVKAQDFGVPVQADNYR